MLSLQIQSETISQKFINSLKELVLSVDPLAKINIKEDYDEKFLDSCLEANEEVKTALKNGTTKTYENTREMFEDMGY